mgnify:CR=1 FL=1
MIVAIVSEGPPVVVEAWDEQDDVRGSVPASRIVSRQYASRDELDAAVAGGRLRRAVRAARHYAALRERGAGVHPLEELACMDGDAGQRARERLLGDDCKEWDR